MDFSRIFDLFSLRAHFDDSTVNSNYIPLLKQIPKYEKNQYLFFTKCKDWKDANKYLEKMKYNYSFNLEVVNTILNQSLKFQEINLLIIFFQILSFLNLKLKSVSFDDENFIKILNALICINPCQVQTKSVYNDIFVFFCNSIIFYFNNHCQNLNQPKACSIEVVRFFSTIECFISKDIFVDFVVLAKDITNEYEESLLDLILIYEQSTDLNEKILMFLQPLCEKYNQKALNCLALLPHSAKNEQIVKYLSNDICQNAGEIDIKANPEELPPLKQKLTKFKYELIETKSSFSKGFMNHIELCDNESEFLLRIINKSTRKKICSIQNSIQIFDQNLIEIFLDGIVDNFNKSEKKEEKFSLFVIFILLINKIGKNSAVSNYSEFIFNFVIFNQDETVFNTIPLDPILDAIRSLVFSIVSFNGNFDIDSKICSISNPLFIAEFFCRIKNLKSFYNQVFIESVIHTSIILQNIDIENHSENIEKARSSVFYVLSTIFLEMKESYQYFDQIMQFCYEKSITVIFVNLFKESLRVQRNNYEFEPVISFINMSMNTKNYEIAWRFIDILSEFFMKFKQCPELTLNIFDILLNYCTLCESHSYEAFQYAIQFASYYTSIKASQLKLISQLIQKFDSPELYEQLTSLLGYSQTKNFGHDGFLIESPIFLLIFALAYGFTNKVIKLFNEIINFSILNATYFHKYKIDYILVQLFSKGDSKFISDGVEFEIQMGVLQKMKDLLFKIMKVNSDYSIISIFLKNRYLVPELNYLLNNALNFPLPIIPIGFFQPNYFCNKLNSSHFQKTFTLTFWLLIDSLVEVQNLDINLISIVCNNNVIKIYIEKSKVKMSLETKQTKTEVMLRQNISFQMKWSLFSLIFDSDSYTISTLINGSELCQSKFVPIPFSNNSSVKFSVGGSYNLKYDHQLCGYVGTISFYSRALTKKEIVNLYYVKASTTNFDPSIVVASSSIPGDFTYMKRSYTYETILSTLCNQNTINKIFELLFEEETEEGCYNYLALINSIALSAPIDYTPIQYFISQENHFHFKKLYRIVYSIFENISSKFEFVEEKDNEINEAMNKDNENNNNLNISLNSNFIKKNSKPVLTLQQKWFKFIIINIDIWINYSNFDEILYIWCNNLLPSYHFLFKDNHCIWSFLGKIDKFEEKNFSKNHWDLFFLFIERLSFYHVSADEEKLIFSMISELISKFQNVMTTDDYIKNMSISSDSLNEIKRIEPQLSNISDLCKLTFGDEEFPKITKKNKFLSKNRRKSADANDKNDMQIDPFPSFNQGLNAEKSQSSDSSSDYLNRNDDNDNDNNEKDDDDDFIDNDDSLENSNNKSILFHRRINRSSSIDFGNNRISSKTENKKGSKGHRKDHDNKSILSHGFTHSTSIDLSNLNYDQDFDNEDPKNKKEENNKKKSRRMSKIKFLKFPFLKKKKHSSDQEQFDLISEKTINRLIYLLQLARFISNGKNSKNNKYCIDDEEIENSSSEGLLSPRVDKQKPMLAYQIQSTLQRESKQSYIVFSSLRIKDPEIICESLYGIHEIIPYSSVLKYTSEALRLIDPNIYEDVIQYLCKQIHMHPYLFPLLCALIMFNTKSKEEGQHSMISQIFHDQDFVNNLNEVFINDNFEKWAFFPLMLAFFTKNKKAKELIFSVIAKSVNGNWESILNIISFITYIQNSFSFSHYDSLMAFYNSFVKFNSDIKNIGDIFVQICYSLFFVTTQTKSKKNLNYLFNNIDDALNFVNQTNTNFEVNFFIKLKNEMIYRKGLTELALSLLQTASSNYHVYNHEYISNAIFVLRSILHQLELKKVEEFAMLCKNIEKMRRDFKEQYTKSINHTLETVKRSLSSKSFHEFSTNKFRASISSPKNLSLVTLDGAMLNSFQQSMPDSSDHFISKGLKQKKSVDVEFRQGILEQISNSAPERKIDIKEDSINCSIFKEKGGDPIPASFELKKGVITIKTDFKCMKIDRKEIIGYKRENQAIEFLTSEGKLIYVIFNDTEANKLLRSKMTKKKVASRKVTNKMLSQKIENWSEYKLTTFQLLMFVNFYEGRTPKSKEKACFPSMLSSDLNKSRTDDQLFEFSDKLTIENTDFDVDFVDDEKPEDDLIHQLRNKNVISAELYYFFESISDKKMIPKEIAKDRFELVYKLRKMIENISNIEIWINKIFNIAIPHRLPYQKPQASKKKVFLFNKNKAKIYFVAQINSSLNYIICSTEGQIFIVNDKEIKSVSDKLVDISIEAKFFALSDGIVIYNDSLHTLVTIDKNGNNNVIENIFIDPTIILFSGSIKRMVYLSTPTRINLVRELTFRGSLIPQSFQEKRKILLTSTKIKPTCSKLDIDGNQQIRQIPSYVKILKASLNFNIIVTFSDDSIVRIISLYEGNQINKFNLKGKVALEIIITELFGFIFIATKTKAYLLTNNGTFIKKVKFNFHNVVKWFSFTSRNGVDYIGFVQNNGDKNSAFFFEAFYLDKINENIVGFDAVPRLLSIAFNPLTEEFVFIDRDGKVIKVQSPKSI